MSSLVSLAYVEGFTMKKPRKSNLENVCPPSLISTQDAVTHCPASSIDSCKLWHMQESLSTGLG